jgi:RimJ/RimL family protein N-acetyltransferase
MLDAAHYSALETLRNGCQVEIRALRPEDRDELVAAAGRLSPHSHFRRFLGVRREFSKEEVSFFVNVDFVDHVALVAVSRGDGRSTIIGGGRYIVVQPGQAEIAFAIVDEYQGQGLGAALMRHLGLLARDAGLQELVADVLQDNVAMQKVFKNTGFPQSTERGTGVVHITMRLP